MLLNQNMIYTDQRGFFCSVFLAAPGTSALDSFKECIDILETSIQRHNKTTNTSPNTTLNSSVLKHV